MNLEAMQIGGFTVSDLEQFVSLRAGLGVHVFFFGFWQQQQENVLRVKKLLTLSLCPMLLLHNNIT